MYLEILSGVLNKNRRSIAKAITHVENNTEISPKLLSDIYKSTGNSYRIGITGPPGAGKSSLKVFLTKQTHNALQSKNPKGHTMKLTF